MKVSVTKDELQQTLELLEALERWTAVCKLKGQYNGGMVSIGIQGNAGHMSVSAGTQEDRNCPKAGDNRVKACEKQIGKLVGNTCEQMAKQVCEIIKAHMPIPVDQ